MFPLRGKFIQVSLSSLHPKEERVAYMMGDHGKESGTGNLALSGFLFPNYDACKQHNRQTCKQWWDLRPDPVAEVCVAQWIWLILGLVISHLADSKPQLSILFKVLIVKIKSPIFLVPGSNSQLNPNRKVEGVF